MNTLVLDDSIKEYFRLLLASKKEKSVKQKTGMMRFCFIWKAILGNKSLKSCILPVTKEVAWKRLELVFLPPYSSNLNKIEELWGWLKASVINNVLFHTRDKIQFKGLYKNLLTG